MECVCIANVNESSALRLSADTTRIWGDNEFMRVVEDSSLETQEGDDRTM